MCRSTLGRPSRPISRGDAIAWRPHSRARVDARAPSAWAQCDRCSFVYLHSELQWQTIYAGPNLQNTFLLVCRSCWDRPNPQLKPRILPPDPIPISNPRVPNFEYMESSDISTQDDIPIVTEDGENIVNQLNFDIPDDIA